MREFSTSTLPAVEIDNSMFLDMLSHNIQNNNAIEVNGGWDCNVVISRMPHTVVHSSHRSVNHDRFRRVKLNEPVWGHGKHLTKGNHQICYGLYNVNVNVDFEPYKGCCCFLSILISLSYYENGSLYKRLLCDGQISDLVSCD